MNINIYRLRLLRNCNILINSVLIVSKKVYLGKGQYFSYKLSQMGRASFTFKITSVILQRQEMIDEVNG